MAKKYIVAGPSSQRAGYGSEHPELLSSSHCMLLLAGKRKLQYCLNSYSYTEWISIGGVNE